MAFNLDRALQILSVVVSTGPSDHRSKDGIPNTRVDVGMGIPIDAVYILRTLGGQK